MDRRSSATRSRCFDVLVAARRRARPRARPRHPAPRPQARQRAPAGHRRADAARLQPVVRHHHRRPRTRRRDGARTWPPSNSSTCARAAAGQIDARTDLYSLGVMAFEMLTGSVPFPASSKDLIDMDGLIEQRRQRPPSDPRTEPGRQPGGRGDRPQAARPRTGRPLPVGRRTEDRHRSPPRRPAAPDRPRAFRSASGSAKWRRRNPGVPGRLIAAALFGLVVGLGALAYERHEANARTEAVGRARRCASHSTQSGST